MNNGAPGRLSDVVKPNNRRRMIDTITGVIGGGIVGAIVAVNIVIYAGPDDGYESSIDDVFRHNVLIGVVTVAALIAGPILGVVVARRLRTRRSGDTEV